MTLYMCMFATVTLLCHSVATPHPLTMSIKVLFLAISICTLLAFNMTWYAIMLFMVSVGGVLVMLTYISCTSSNAVFPLKPQAIQLTTQATLTLLLMMHSTNPTPTIFNTQNQYHLPKDPITLFMSSQNSSLLLLMGCTLMLSMSIAMTVLNSTNTTMRPTRLNPYSASSIIT